MYLLQYTAKNTSGYMLVHARNFESAEQLLREKFFYLTDLVILNATL